MGKNLARLARFEPGPRAARWLAEAGVEAAWVYEIPLTTQFRGITARDGLILAGPGGLAEAAPFWNYAPAVARRWFEGALAIAREGLPVPPAPVALNVTVPIVPPEVASQIVRESGCRTAKVKVADPRANLDADVARVRAVRAALDELWGPGAAINAPGSDGFMRCQSGWAPHEPGVNNLATGGNAAGGGDILSIGDGVNPKVSGWGQAPHEVETNATNASGEVNASGGYDAGGTNERVSLATNASGATQATQTGGGQIRVDVNAAWSLEQAQENLPRLVEAAGRLEYAEQPCRDLRDLAVLQAEGIAPIAADESIRLAPDPALAIREVVAAGLAAMVIKAMPLRGPAAALQALAQAMAQAFAPTVQRQESLGFATQEFSPETVNRDRFQGASTQRSFGGDAKSLPSPIRFHAATAAPRENNADCQITEDGIKTNSERNGTEARPMVVVSSALDSGVGLVAGMSLATMLYQDSDPQTSPSLAGAQKNTPGNRFSPSITNPQPSVAMGLGTGRLMRGGILVEEPRLENGYLIAPIKPQLNLDLPAPDAELSARWRERLEMIAGI
ncbi:O-succinylbenzoate synthase [Mobiluncus mulieris FB024-16]|uniref:enolase C-terminal domain-like protein n=1 Tax=Mobiluncus mulieris TaxID=2052 RepID=UPI0001E517DE|nr:enolase C-terminal domain-like protein [Mobiluncus mulieris]EFN92710.1 O-succinylbenzoate synthase [Mobiluncus mulieris FB024-16]